MPYPEVQSVGGHVKVKKLIEEKSFTVHLDNKLTSQVERSKDGTLSRWILNRFCIFCDEDV